MYMQVALLPDKVSNTEVRCVLYTAHTIWLGVLQL